MLKDLNVKWKVINYYTFIQCSQKLQRKMIHMYRYRKLPTLVPNKNLCISIALTFSFVSFQQRNRHSTLSNIPNTQHSILATGGYHMLLVGMSINTVEGHSVTSPFVGDTMTSNMLSSRIYLCTIHENMFPSSN